MNPQPGRGEPAPEETAESRRKRWLAVLSIAACYGLSAYFVTGDISRAGGFAFVVLAIFSLLIVVFARWVDTRKPLSTYYAYGLLVLVSPLVALAVGSYRTPWSDFQERYPASRPAPEGLDGGSAVVLAQPVDEFQVKPHSFKRATSRLTDDGVYLALAWPLSIVYDPLWLPVAAVTECRASYLDSMYTSLAVRGEPSRIELLDPGERVLKWCKEREIGDGREDPEGLRP